MFTYYYVHVERPFEDVEPALLRMLPGLSGWARDAYRTGERLHARVGPHGADARLAKTVEITVGAPIRAASETWIPVRWEATGAPWLFPRLDADIVIARIGPALTQIALRGSYRSPLGPVGRAFDRVLLHRIAEASVKAFVDRIVDALSEGDVGVVGGTG